MFPSTASERVSIISGPFETAWSSKSISLLEEANLCKKCETLFARNDICEIIKSPSGLEADRKCCIHASPVGTFRHKYFIVRLPRKSRCLLCHWLFDEKDFWADKIFYWRKAVSLFRTKVHFTLKGDLLSDNPLQVIWLDDFIRKWAPQYIRLSSSRGKFCSSFQF